MKTLIAIVAVLSLSTALPAQADCFDAAATYQHVNPYVLRAIAWQESRNQGNAIHKNENGSTDYGLMQSIRSICPRSHSMEFRPIR